MKAVSDELRQAYTVARRALVIKFPFLGELALSLRLFEAEPIDRVSTSAVAPDFTLVMSKEFFMKLPPGERVGNVAHEVMHPGLNHFWLIPRFGKVITNLAGDYTLNPIIKAAGLDLPTGALISTRFTHMASERVAEILEKERPPEEEDGEGGNGPGREGSCGSLRPDLCSTEKGKAAVAGDQSAQQELEMEAKSTIMSAAMSAKMQGKLPGEIETLINKMLVPKMTVKERILRFCGQHGPRVQRNLLPPSRRSEAAGVLLPSLKAGAPKVCNLLDTSGSVDDDEFAQYVGFVDKVTTDLQMDVLTVMCDATVQGVIEGVSDGQDIGKRRGHGGSNFGPAFEYLRKEGFDGVVIALTDGYIEVPQRRPPEIQACLWVISKYGKAPTEAWGETIYLEEDRNE